MSKWFVVLTVMVLLVFGIAACDGVGGAEGDAADLLPNLDGYNTIEGESFTDALTTLGIAATLAGQPELGAPIAAVSEVVACYQDSGAVSARVYSLETNPLQTGVVATGDRNALLNPITFLQCVPLTEGDERAPATIEPCYHSYTLTRDNNEFYILYAGITPEICQTFCSNLEGCTGH